MSRWKFQISPNVPDVVGKRYRMDPTCENVEAEVNAAMPFPLKFHGIVKLVVALGQDPEPVEDYRELLRVAKKQWPQFDLRSYSVATESEKRRELEEVVRATFAWLENHFDDAQFVSRTRKKIPWAT